MRDAAKARDDKAIVRCAIYTRKSTEDGLEQEFNSLDAQREACEAYILSQRHEGWTLVPGAYDDGGFSGGTIERPGLQRLLADVAANRVDCIVVYKIDRLTRSLADFSRIVDVLDKASASFVSITQAFNTTTSMGRLTLNVLLSFAQFEREVTGERIRDKIAASKAKGMWMGGVVALGYRVCDRKLVVVEAEAERVRHIFKRYLALGSVPALWSELSSQGITGKSQAFKTGRVVNAKPMSRGALYLLLRNRLYVGEITHKGAAFPGEHDGIVPRPLFDEVQRQLDAKQVDHARGARVDHPSLLAGLLYDTHGRRMSPSHAVKNKVRRYRYYVSRIDGPNPTLPIWRVPASDIEVCVLGRLSAYLCDQSAIHEAVGGDDLDGAAIHTALFESEQTAQALSHGFPSGRREILGRLLRRVTLHSDSIEIEINRSSLCELAGVTTPSTADGPHEPICIKLDARLAKVGREVKLVVPPGHSLTPEPHPSLIKLVAKAHRARIAVECGSGQSMDEIAKRLGHNREYFGVLVRLGYLAPDIVEGILAGRQSATVARQGLARMAGLPLAWSDQERMLGAG